MEQAHATRSMMMRMVRMAAMLHDVGKVGIPDGTSEFDTAALEAVLTHHERWDGTGYPGHVDVMTGRPLAGVADV